jgi:hypothetical protein
MTGPARIVLDLALVTAVQRVMSHLSALPTTIIANQVTSIQRMISMIAIVAQAHRKQAALYRILKREASIL